MGFLSFFRRSSADDICNKLSIDIILTALQYCKKLDANDNGQAAKAGREYAIFLLHMLDRQAFAMLGELGRDAIFDYVSYKVVNVYTHNTFQKGSSSNTIKSATREMWQILNERQSSYSLCKLLISDDGFASKGTLIFALSYFIHRVMEPSAEIGNVDSVLRGDVQLDDETISNLPDLFCDWGAMSLSIEVMTALKKSELPKLIKKLQGRSHQITRLAA